MERDASLAELRLEIDAMFERLDKEFGALVLRQVEILEQMEAENDSTK